MVALTKRFHITVSNKHSHFHTTTETLLNLQFNGKDIDTHNDRVRKILADTEEVGLGVIPEKFIRQIYLKSLPPQWNSGDDDDEDSEEKQKRFDPYTGDRLFCASEVALLAGSKHMQVDGETLVYIDSMAGLVPTEYTSATTKGPDITSP